jgi:hypothetical protein
MADVLRLKQEQQRQEDLLYQEKQYQRWQEHYRQLQEQSLQLTDWFRNVCQVSTVAHTTSITTPVTTAATIVAATDPVPIPFQEQEVTLYETTTFANQMLHTNERDTSFNKTTFTKKGKTPSLGSISKSPIHKSCPGDYDIHQRAECRQLKSRTAKKANFCHNSVDLNTQQRTNTTNKLKSCTGCFIKHQRADCRHRRSTCNFCNKFGHISTVCYSRKRQQLLLFNQTTHRNQTYFTSELYR